MHPELGLQGRSAGSVIPFKSLDIVYVGAITSSGSINVTSKCPNYKKMTAGDFLLDYQSMAVRLWDGKIGGSTINVSKSYNSSTGVLTLSNLSASSSTSYVRCTVGGLCKSKLIWRKPNGRRILTMSVKYSASICFYINNTFAICV